MNDNNKQDKSKAQNTERNYVISPFKFIMMLLSTIIITAAVTAFAILSGNEKIISDDSQKRSEFVKLYAVYDTLNKNYYKKVEKEKLIDGAIKGMVSGLDDPYSEYMTSDEQKDFTESMQGDFQGIGTEIEEKDNKIMISSPIKGAPAHKAGVKSGDIIMAVDDKSVEGKSTQDVVKLVRGKKGTVVTLTLKRGDAEPFDVKITRDKIHMNSVEHTLQKDGTGIITVMKFQEGTADEFTDALKALHDKGMEQAVIDLRDNPGGYLDEAAKMADVFLEKDKIIVQMEDVSGNKEILKASKDADEITKDLPTVILLNEGSASASEVFAAALKDNGKAEIVGHKSFGKGIVQTASTFKDKSMIKYTEQKWLTPKSTWIHKKGISPDVKVDPPAYVHGQMLDADEVLTLHEKSEKVKSMEMGLDALGYDTGKVDSTFDESTLYAVQNFQMENNLPVDGIMTGKTTDKFMSQLAKKIENDDVQLKRAIQEAKKK
ncbi:S41 family peptidase [Macrococcoides canis]|uniref:S41 family peptidase n=1 Tax=Macrococcoides canis TaxID=1855823 RepID=UPI001B8B6282|nr:S41 family peptidase [Macrococcus canis]QUR93460.1 PDZ domain-containing protein [Macrococcus canis]UTH05878.1 S41 family peptidase [Macrococcus canis]